jgi:hypothetical protein
MYVEKFEPFVLHDCEQHPRGGPFIFLYRFALLCMRTHTHVNKHVNIQTHTRMHVQTCSERSAPNLVLNI